MQAYPFGLAWRQIPKYKKYTSHLATELLSQITIHSQLIEQKHGPKVKLITISISLVHVLAISLMLYANCFKPCTPFLTEQRMGQRFCGIKGVSHIQGTATAKCCRG